MYRTYGQVVPWIQPESLPKITLCLHSKHIAVVNGLQYQQSKTYRQFCGSVPPPKKKKKELYLKLYGKLN